MYVALRGRPFDDHFHIFLGFMNEAEGEILNQGGQRDFNTSSKKKKKDPLGIYNYLVLDVTINRRKPS